MAVEKGSAFLLKVGDGAAPPAFATVAGLRTTQLSDQRRGGGDHHKDSGGWRAVLSGAGVRSVSVSGAGVFTGSAAEARIKAQCAGGRARRLSAELRERRDDDRAVPGDAARLCRRFQRRAVLHAGLESSGAVVAA